MHRFTLPPQAPEGGARVNFVMRFTPGASSTTGTAPTTTTTATTTATAPSPQAFMTTAATGWTKTFPSRNSGGSLSITDSAGKRIPRPIRMAVSRTMSKVSLLWSAK